MKMGYQTYVMKQIDESDTINQNARNPTFLCSLFILGYTK